MCFGGKLIFASLQRQDFILMSVEVSLLAKNRLALEGALKLTFKELYAAFSGVSSNFQKNRGGKMRFGETFIFDSLKRQDFVVNFRKISLLSKNRLALERVLKWTFKELPVAFFGVWLHRD